jgi:DNA polymerase-4
MRKIIHVDMDCFYAAVEMRDNPKLAEVPLAIGGSSDRRGVISTCNYIARQFGVRSAMASAYAMRLCPDLVLVPGRMSVYQQESKKIRAILEDYTPIIEPLSLDEAYLDVTQCKLYNGSATLIAESIRQRISNELGLTASAGVASCKFVAKVASDENKPDGLCVITPENHDNFVKGLGLGKIPGVGKVTLEKLQRLGLHTCNDVRQYPRERLQKQLGKFGAILWNRAHGIDERELAVSRERKSVGVERTLSDDIYSFEQCLSVVQRLLPRLIERLEKVNQGRGGNHGRKIRSQGIKLKFADFQQTTVEHRQGVLSVAFFEDLLREAYERTNNRGIRLVGLHVGTVESNQQEQLLLPLY